MRIITTMPISYSEVISTVETSHMVPSDPRGDSTPCTSTEYGPRTAPISIGDRRRPLAGIAIRNYMVTSAISASDA
jgi:hypothetical protein